jgi:hypothetical protein
MRNHHEDENCSPTIKHYDRKKRTYSKRPIQRNAGRQIIRYTALFLFWLQTFVEGTTTADDRWGGVTEAKGRVWRERGHCKVTLEHCWTWACNGCRNKPSAAGPPAYHCSYKYFHIQITSRSASTAAQTQISVVVLTRTRRLAQRHLENSTKYRFLPTSQETRVLK